MHLPRQDSSVIPSLLNVLEKLAPGHFLSCDISEDSLVYQIVPAYGRARTSKWVESIITINFSPSHLSLDPQMNEQFVITVNGGGQSVSAVGFVPNVTDSSLLTAGHNFHLASSILPLPFLGNYVLST